MRYRANSCISDSTTEQIHYTEVPVGTIGLTLILVFRILYLSYKAYTYLMDLVLALRNMYLSYGSYTCFTEHILILRILYRAYSGTKVPVGTTQIPYTEVPVGTTRLILILRIREYS